MFKVFRFYLKWYYKVTKFFLNCKLFARKSGFFGRYYWVLWGGLYWGRAAPLTGMLRLTGDARKARFTGGRAAPLTRDAALYWGRCALRGGVVTPSKAPKVRPQ